MGGHRGQPRTPGGNDLLRRPVVAPGQTISEMKRRVGWREPVHRSDLLRFTMNVVFAPGFVALLMVV
jgi:hypothetical protein